MTMRIQKILAQPPGTIVTLQAWVLSKRLSRKVAFFALHDGSCQESIQVVLTRSEQLDPLLTTITTGASLKIVGEVVTSQGAGQAKEVIASAITLLGAASVTCYPLQPKRHSMAFLRTQQHLRFRTRTGRAIFRIRHMISYAIHQFFHQRDFCWVHTPILTGVDAEGAGDLFRVEATEKAFFGKPAYLTVSGQLAGEAAAMGLGNIYAFGPTFRAENSNTTRHLAEFWMVEPEMAFYDLEATISLAQSLLQSVAAMLSAQCQAELVWLTKVVQAEGIDTLPLQQRMEVLLDSKMTRLTYTEALEKLQEAVSQGKISFSHPVAPWGVALQTAHERYLTQHFGGGVVVTDFPKASKAFYMRQNDDGRTVASMDILLPGIGEIIGGSQREERLAKLLEAMQVQGMDAQEMDWYVDTRRFGSVKHSGFGMGLERLVLFVTGMHNIRDVVPFPRTPSHMVG